MNRRHRSPPSPLVALLACVLLAWGIYLAIGASGWFQSKGTRFDGRKATIVATCSLAFLVLWRFVVTSARTSPAAHAPDQAQVTTQSQPLPLRASSSDRWGVFSLGMLLVAWSLSLSPWLFPDQRWLPPVPLLGICLATWLLGMVIAIVRLSDPREGPRTWTTSTLILGILLATYVLLSPLLPRRAPDGARGGFPIPANRAFAARN